MITERDAVLRQLRLWVDFNHDGVSQPAELLTLTSEHVVRIKLKTRETRLIDRYGKPNALFERCLCQRSGPGASLSDVPAVNT